MLRYWLWLSLRKQINQKEKLQILEHFGDPEAAYNAGLAEYLQVGRLSDKKLESLLDKKLKDADDIIRRCDNLNIGILTYQDAAYPVRLKYISDPPLVLYYEGRLPCVDSEVTVGVVGTRKASAYGIKTAKEFGYQLSRGGAIVVSGCAQGIDAAGLQGALLGGKPVIAVLGNGTDVVYPRSHGKLYRDIREHGCLLSEFPPGTPPLSENFPVRNRIIGGLSLGVLVVEAPEKSGALITAQRALEQGRDVFAVPGNLGTPSLCGNLRLLRDGAVMVLDGCDILRQYSAQYDTVAETPVTCDFTEDEAEIPVSKPSDTDKKSVDKKEHSKYIDLEDILPRVTKEGAAVLQCLTDAPLHVDDLIFRSKLSAAKVLVAVTHLEIQGYIKRLPGRRFSLAMES